MVGGIYLGIVHRPEDIRKGRKGILERSLKDLDPAVRKNVQGILEGWEGKKSKNKLKKLIGEKRTKRLMKLKKNSIV